MIYFYRLAWLKHLGFIITFGKNMRQCGEYIQGSNHILKPFLLTVNNPLKVNWACLFFASEVLFHIYTLELSSSTTAYCWPLRSSPTQSDEFVTTTSSTFGFNCSSWLARNTWPFLQFVFANPPPPCNHYLQIIRSVSCWTVSVWSRIVVAAIFFLTVR